MKQVSVLVICLLIFCSCKKSNSSVGRAMNAHEQLLIGTWKVTQEADTETNKGGIDTFNAAIFMPRGTPYIQFTNENYSSTSSEYLSCFDADRLSVSGGEHYTYYSPQRDYWRFDTIGNLLQINDAGYVLIPLTPSTIILEHILTSVETYSAEAIYLQKE